MWNVKAQVLLPGTIIGATGTISISFRQYPSKIPGEHEIKGLQNTVMLGTAHLMWRVLL